jgi:hypothetical protein
MDCYCNNSDITIGFEYLADEINEVYHRLINFSFIIKTLTFSHAILDKLISIILEASLIEIKTSKD